jgi:hypothetical protein
MYSIVAMISAFLESIGPDWATSTKYNSILRMHRIHARFATDTMTMLRLGENSTRFRWGAAKALIRKRIL